jgi:hypothetical protein
MLEPYPLWAGVHINAPWRKRGFSVEFACSSAWVTNCLGYQPLELRLQVDVALPLVAIQGQASDEVTAVLSRARDLNQKLGETPQTFGAIRALHWLSFAHADYRGAFELCEQLSRIAERVNNPDFRAEALRARANSSFYLGQLTDSREFFERVLSICIEKTAVLKFSPMQKILERPLLAN